VARWWSPYLERSLTHAHESPAFDALLGVVDQVFPVDRPAVNRAKAIVLGTDRLSAREAVHLAVIEQHGIKQILSFDAGFDGWAGLERLTR